jgi:hypothetical protein
MQADAYIAKGITPTKLYAIRVDNMTGPERTMIGTLQGIIAESSEEQIYIRPIAGGYDTWLDDLETNYGVERVKKKPRISYYDTLNTIISF